MKNKVYIIVGSMRRNRIGPQVAAWVMHNHAALAGFPSRTELVDLNDWHLPLSDEPAIPATGVYANEHTKAWSQKIAAANGYVFVTPQYNWGYPASLKKMRWTTSSRNGTASRPSSSATVFTAGARRPRNCGRC